MFYSIAVAGRGNLMDWDDEYDSGYNDMSHASHRDTSMPDKSAEGGLDPMDIANPVNAIFS